MRPQKHCLVVLACLTGLSGLLIVQAQSADEFEKSENDEIALLENKQFAKALELNGKLFSEYPKLQRLIWLDRGTIFYAMRNYDEAIVSFDRSLALGKSAQTFTLKGQVLSDAGKYSEAIDSYNQALLIQPTRVTALINRASCEILTGQTDKALRDLNEAILVNPNEGAAYSSRGLIEMDRHDYDAAKADMDKAVQLSPYDGAVVGNRSLIYWALKDKGQALADAEKAARLNSRFQATLAWMKVNDIDSPPPIKKIAPNLLDYQKH